MPDTNRIITTIGLWLSIEQELLIIGMGLSGKTCPISLIIEKAVGNGGYADFGRVIGIDFPEKKQADLVERVYRERVAVILAGLNGRGASASPFFKSRKSGINQNMNIKNFRQKIWQADNILIDGKMYPLKETVRFDFPDGNFYIKCFLGGDYVLADDEAGDYYLLVKKVETPFSPPFPEKLEFKGRELKFIFEARAVAREIKGEEIFRIGDAEKFWDYKAADGSYLSLGINDATGQRLDFYGRIIEKYQVELE